jgi:hypothetical protein
MLLALCSVALARPLTRSYPRTYVREAPFRAAANPVQMGLMDWLSSLSGDELISPAAESTLTELCRPEGWRVRCEIGQEVARAVGGSGALAKGGVSSTALLDLRLQFALDDGYAPPQGSVTLLKESRFFVNEPGFWKVEADDDDGTPQQISWRLRVGDAGLLVDGDRALLAPGQNVYFNAMSSWTEGGVARGTDGGLILNAGRITVKEDIGINVGLFDARGILAEFKIVGVFECSRVAS